MEDAMPVDLPSEAANPSLQETLERAVELAQMFARVARRLADDRAPSAEMLAMVDRGWAAHERLEDVATATQFDLMRAVEHAAVHGTGAALDWFERHWPDHAPDPGKFDEAVKAWPVQSRWKEVAAAVESARLGEESPDSLQEVWHHYRHERRYPPLHSV
jgi:hypothetical protein